MTWFSRCHVLSIEAINTNLSMSLFEREKWKILHLWITTDETGFIKSFHNKKKFSNEGTANREPCPKCSKTERLRRQYIEIFESTSTIVRNDISSTVNNMQDVLCGATLYIFSHSYRKFFSEHTHCFFLGDIFWPIFWIWTHNPSKLNRYKECSDHLKGLEGLYKTWFWWKFLAQKEISSCYFYSHSSENIFGWYNSSNLRFIYIVKRLPRSFK